MAKGMALTIGLNSVNPKHYNGWSGELLACEADASDMANIVKEKKFKVRTLLTKKATRKNVIKELTKAASKLKSGDIFMLSYSGHGGQVPDLHGDEPDREDETWCLYNGQLIDDELNELLGKFARGTRILVFSDSCHSGTVVRLAAYNLSAGASEGSAAGTGEVRYRFMPSAIAIATYNKNRAFYKPILENPKLKNAAKKVKASVLLISGCQDNQYSADGTFNGLFTGTLLAVWDRGNFSKDYKTFHQEIVNRMPPEQTPNYFRVGEVDPDFEAQIPFTK